MDDNRELIGKLLACGIFRVGNFKLKTGTFSPVYIDLRRIIAFPKIIQDLAKAIRAKQLEKEVQTDVVCGVPYTALPIASLFSVLYDIPMVMKRKEAKDYGTKKMIEGNINVDEKCLIIEDIVSSGTSVIETADALRKEGLKVHECIVVVNRNQGGEENLRKVDIKLYSLFDVNEIFNAYCTVNPVEAELVEKVKLYFKDNSYLAVKKPEPCLKLGFGERAQLCSHPTAKKLFQIMESKKTNLCVAIDTTSSNELLDLANRLGPHICLLKTHIDIINDFSPSVTDKLKELSSRHNFLIFEDRKFADIGNTVKHQFTSGLYQIQKWADLITVHAIPGSGVIQALKDDKCALVLIAEMSSEGALTNDDYRENVFTMADNNPDCVVGFVAQKGCSKANLIHMCPGVHIDSSGDCLGQKYKSPEEAVANGADIIIVGRGIIKSSNIEAAAITYKTKGYDAYVKSVKV